METDEVKILEVKERIFKNAGKKLLYFQQLDAFNSPATFWSLALQFNLCSEEEFEQARQYYGDIWNLGD